MHIAILGTGLMGRPVAEKLSAAGHTIAVYNRMKQKAEELSRQSITVFDRPEDAIRTAECVILFLTDGPAIRSVLFSGAARHLLSGRTVIQMGTIGPSESQAFELEIAQAGGGYFEVPVLGSIPEVRAGTLLVMVRGTPSQFDRWQDVLRCLGHGCAEDAHTPPVGSQKCSLPPR